MAEETQVKDSEREALIMEMLRDAHKTEPPSELTRNPIISRGEETGGAPVVVNKITSAGYVYLWDTRNYQEAPILYYMLQQKLRERRKDGSYRWTTVDPGRKPRRGTYRCLLHTEDSNREHYNSLGFPVCPKGNLANLYEVRRHMQLKHKSVWAAIEEERRQNEREEDRALQKLLLANQLNKAATETSTELPKEEKPKKSTYVCDICGADFGTEVTLTRHKAAHK